MIHLGRVLGKRHNSESGSGEKSILEGIKKLNLLRAKPALAEGYFYLAEFYADNNQRDMAVENLKTAEAMFRDMGMDYWIAKAQKNLARLRRV